MKDEAALPTQERCCHPVLLQSSNSCAEVSAPRLPVARLLGLSAGHGQSPSTPHHLGTHWDCGSCSSWEQNCFLLCYTHLPIL